MSIAARTPRASWADALATRKANSLVGAVGTLTDDNRRWAHRRSSATAATLNGSELGDPVPCVVLDTSSTGARVRPHFARGARCQTLKDLPDHFTIIFTIERVAMDCVVAWRRDGEVGLRFVSPARTVPKPKRVMIVKGKK
jgi:hypothetical protein